MNNDVLRLLALWALIHETADEAWKEAVARGAGRVSGASGEVSFSDALAAVVAEEKEKLKTMISSGGNGGLADGAGLMEEIRFELGQLRGRLESMEAALNGITARLAAKETPRIS